MQNKLATLALIGLSAIALTACGSAPTKAAEATREPAKPMLSEVAQQALDKAEADVKNAQARYALWTTAKNALAAAEDAAKAGDSAAVIKHAQFASSQAALGIAQLAYPGTEQK